MIAEKMKSLEKVGDRAMGKVPAPPQSDEDDDPLTRNLKEVQKIMGGAPVFSEQSLFLRRLVTWFS
jgi:hypothetical protein